MPLLVPLWEVSTKHTNRGKQPANEHLDEVKTFVQSYGMAGKKVLDIHRAER